MNIFSWQSSLLFLSVLMSGLLAGLFYGYACSVNGGLGRLSDPEYLRAMQSINKVILNPVFFFSLMGTLSFLPIAAGVNYTADPSVRFYLLFLASVIYLAGVFGVTVAGNVPLNEALASFTIDGASASALSDQRAKFEASWNRYHGIRTIASIVSFSFTILSLFKIK